jgi:hypothetical protein
LDKSCGPQFRNMEAAVSDALQTHCHNRGQNHDTQRHNSDSDRPINLISGGAKPGKNVD